MKWSWFYVAMIVERDYGAYVDWCEEFFECPECGEPIYDGEWTRGELLEFFCPICEWEGD